MKKVEYLTPSEIMEEFPELEEQFGWDARMIGTFLKGKALKGKYNSNQRKSYITRNSLKQFVAYIKECNTMTIEI